MSRHFSALVAGGMCLALSACDAPPPPAARTVPVEETRNAETTLPTGGGEAMPQRQAAFLNRLREADPEQRTIDRAMLNASNELGLILDHRVEMDKIPALMKTMLAQMAREFPGQDLTVLAYTPSDPPRKVGTARLNAQTRDMTYTPER